MINVLVVEDEKSLSEIMYEVLVDSGYQVELACNGIEGYEKFSQKNIDLIISDIMMPNMDGWEMIKLIRKKNNDIPIIVLSALSEESDEIKGFDLGVNDYIAKPFSFKIFQKRIESILKLKNLTSTEIIKGELRINHNSREIHFKDLLVDLTLKEYELLIYLVENEEKVLSREQMLQHVWGYTYEADLRNIDTHIKNIRRKLPDIKIKTVTGIGYRFDN